MLRLTGLSLETFPNKASPHVASQFPFVRNVSGYSRNPCSLNRELLYNGSEEGGGLIFLFYLYIYFFFSAAIVKYGTILTNYCTMTSLFQCLF